MPSNTFNPQGFADLLGSVLKASHTHGATRACLLLTRDREYSVRMMVQVAHENNTPLYHFSLAGRRRFHADRNAWELTGNAGPDRFALLQQASETRESALVILEECMTEVGEERGDPRMRVQLAQMLSSESVRPGLVLVFLEPSSSASHVPSMLADQFVRLEVPYPRAQELVAIASQELAAAFGAAAATQVDRIRQESQRFSAHLAGFTRSAARDALRDSLARDPRNLEGALQWLQERKMDLLRQQLAMNVLDNRVDEQPVGLDYLVDHLRVLQPRMSISGSERARGILLVGPPGTGKTMIARAIGNIVNLPVVDFCVNSLINSLVGESEHLFTQAFATLEAMSPNVVFIDELEKAFGDSSERDGGTMMRCTGGLLSWLSDNPYPNFIVATANNIRRMGEIGLTMTRSGRFDAAFFVDVPSCAARELMLMRWLKPVIADPESVAHDLARVTEKFTGADLYTVVKLARSRAEYEGATVEFKGLNAAVESRRMRAIALYDEFQDLRRWGRLYCEPAGPTGD